MPSNYSFLDRFVGGSALPGTLDDLQAYEDDGVTDIFSLTPNLPLVTRYYEGDILQFHHLPVYATPDDMQITRFLELIKEIRHQGTKAVIHCQYGQERTGMFLAIYLIEILGMDVTAAISTIREQREGSLRTQHALNYLYSRYNI